MGRHTASETGRPLLVTADDQVLDELLRLARSASVDVDVAADAGSARRRWPHATLVVLDDEVAADAASIGLPRRAGVVVLGRDVDDSDVWRRALNIGADHVVFLPDAGDWLVEQLAQPLPASDQGRLLAVLSAAGGAGASTLAASLALRATARELASVLVDGDPHGGGLDLLLGAEASPGIRWRDLGATSGRIERRTLLDALPEDGGMPFLSWSQSVSEELAQDCYDSVVSALLRDGDLVVADVGRSLGRLTDSIVARTTTAVLLVPARVRAVAAATQLLDRLDQLRDHTVLVVRRPSPAALDVDTIAHLLGVPLVGTLPHDGRRAEWEENGLPPSTKGPWARVADAILDQQATRVTAA